MADALSTIEELQHDDEWIATRISREQYEQGEPEVQAAGSVLSYALEDVDERERPMEGASQPSSVSS